MRSPSQRLLNVQAPMIPVVGEWIAQHPGTISLGQGIVHYDPPATVRDAVHQALDDSRIDRYGLVSGTQELLDGLAAKLTVENGITIDDSVCLLTTAGSNMAFVNAVLAIADLGDEIILLAPFYFNHQMAIEIAGCRAVIVSTDNRYQIDVESIAAAITPRTRAVVTISPNNPTGAVYSVAALRSVNALCRERGLFHISDEAYEYFVYGDDPHFSPGSDPDAASHTISLYTLSKAYGMAGWRVGYMVAPAELATSIKKIQDTNLVCPPQVGQVAAAAALRAGRGWCEQQIAGFSEVRDLVLAELSQLGKRCRIPRPEGAFYALLQLDTLQSDVSLVERLIREFGVAVMPGSTFGAAEPCSLRVAYGALDRETVASGMGRLVKGLRAIL